MEHPKIEYEQLKEKAMQQLRKGSHYLAKAEHLHPY
jgi:hypothetical protein